MFFRRLSKRCLWLRYWHDTKELSREYPIRQLGGRGKIPDPWDDYPRSEYSNRSWKFYRNTQYRVKSVVRPKQEKVEVVYHTKWVRKSVKYFWFSKDLTRYRVREAYRRYRV